MSGELCAPLITERRTADGNIHQLDDSIDAGRCNEETLVSNIGSSQGFAVSQVRLGTAFLAIILGAFCHSLMSLFSKMAMESFPEPQVLMARYAVTLLYTSTSLVFRRESLLGPHSVRLLLVARGFTGLASQVCHVFALSRLPLASAVALHEAFPVFTVLLAHLTLNEPLTSVSIVSAIVAMTGCSIIAHAESSGTTASKNGSLLGVIAGIAGAVFASSAFQLMRGVLRGTEIPVRQEHVIWYYALISFTMVIFSPVCNGGFILHASPTSWVALAGVAATSLMEQLLVTTGFKHLPAGAATLALTIEMAFAFFNSAVILREPVHPQTSIGASCITFAVSAVALQQMCIPKSFVMHQQNLIHSAKASNDLVKNPT
eukprot:TRINITY_DN47057_c0_g1_i1.p1 TRINITY_DN47057_c0_g1~~TRINITY_DN47057_c0_g1_i1.p1  ORF type:complete len:374 (+),score=41.34 TRINITY_DN47057_c0_g1_i1:42-1163(+)